MLSMNIVGIRALELLNKCIDQRAGKKNTEYKKNQSFPDHPLRTLPDAVNTDIETFSRACNR